MDRIPGCGELLPGAGVTGSSLIVGKSDVIDRDRAGTERRVVGVTDVVVCRIIDGPVVHRLSIDQL